MKRVAYSESGTWVDLLLSTVSHVSLLHYSKNAGLLVLCASAMMYYSIPARWLTALVVSIPVNYTYAQLVGPVMGASGGAFALLGVVSIVVYRRDKRLTVALIPLAIHQATIAVPEIAIAHSVAFAVGVSVVKFSELEIEIDYNDRINRA